MSDRIITDDAFDQNYLVWQEGKRMAGEEITEGFTEWLDAHADLVGEAAEETAATMLQQVAGVPGLGARLSDTAIESIVVRTLNAKHRAYKNLKVVYNLFHLKPELSRREIIAAAVKGYTENWNEKIINQLFNDLYGNYSLTGKRLKREEGLVYTVKNWRPVFQRWFED